MKNIAIKKILVPFDFNENFTNSLGVAKYISKVSGASITIIHVVSQLATIGSDYVKSCILPLAKFDLYAEEHRKEIENYLANKNMKDVTIKIEVGDYNAKIIESCKVEKYDLIIVPDFLKTPLDRLLTDINPLLIMEKTKTAVISINNYAGNYEIKNIMLPIRNVVNWFKKVPHVIEIANITGAKIFVLGVANSSSKKVQQNIFTKMEICSNHFERFSINFELDTVFGHGDPYYDVLMESKYKNVNLIAVSSPAEFIKLKSLFNSNFYNKLISNGNIPVLGMA